MLRSATLSLCLIVPQAGAQQTLPPEIRIDEVQHFYELDALSVDSMRKQLDTRGPRTLFGRATPGLTRHELTVQYMLQPVEGSCSIEGIEIETRIETDLPHWKPRHTPSKSLESQWTVIEPILVEHERGHHDNGVWASTEMLRRLRAIAAQPDCSTLGAIAKTVRIQLLRELRERESAYDQATDHGRIQIRERLPELYMEDTAAPSPTAQAGGQPPKPGATHP